MHGYGSMRPPGAHSIENTVFILLLPEFVFAELLPGNALIKTVTLRTVSKPVFIVQVTKLVQFTKYKIFLKTLPSTSMHFATRVRTWRVARLYSEIAVSRKPFRIRHMYIYTIFAFFG
jgi:hypothetical protein